MHTLEVPEALAGPNVQRDDAIAEQIVPRAEPAEVVVRGRVGRQIDDPPFRVGGHGCPRVDVAAPLPGVALPGLVAELTGPGDDVELPEVLPRARVVREDVARNVLLPRVEPTREVRVADDHHAVHDERRGRIGDVADRIRDPVVGVVRMPQRGRRIERRDRTTLPGDGEEPAVRIDRCRAKDIVGRRPEVVAPPEPGLLKVVEVLGVDLVEGRVARAPGVGAPVAPLAEGGAAVLGVGRTRDRKGGDEGEEAGEQE